MPYPIHRGPDGRKARPLTTILLAALAIACGKGESNPDTADAGSTPGAGSVPRDACALLSAADVQTVLGQAVRDSLALAMPSRDAVTLSQCNYATAENPAAVSFMLQRSVPGEGIDVAAHGARQSLIDSGVQPEDVPGLGAVAFWGGNQLHVFTSAGWYLIVTPVPSGGLPQARALVERALAKLSTG